MMGPPAATPSTVPAQIRAERIAALKFCSERVDIREDGRLVCRVGKDQARQLLAKGTHESVGNSTVKYLRPLPLAGRSVDGPDRTRAPRAQANFTTVQAGYRYDHEFMNGRNVRRGVGHPYSPAARTIE